MSEITAGLLGLGLLVVGTLAADMISEEIRGQLDRIPFALLRMAGKRLPPEMRTALYAEEWYPELVHILRGAEQRPISRLIQGVRYALGLLRVARSVGLTRAGADVRTTVRMRRLVSITDALHTVGELATISVELVLAAGLGMLAGTLTPILLGIGAHGAHLQITLALTLTVVFVAVIGGLCGVAMGPGIRTVMRRLLRPRIRAVEETIVEHGRLVVALQAFNARVLGPDQEKTSSTGWSAVCGVAAGVCLGLLVRMSLPALTEPLLTLGGLLAGLLAVRVICVNVSTWWYRRRSERLLRSS